MKRNPLRRFLPFAVLILPMIAAWPQRSQAADIYWDNVGGTANDWAGVANWSSVIAGGTNPTAIPGAADMAFFSASSVTAAQTVNLNAARSLLGMTFTTTLAHTVAGGGTNRILTLGASGITKTGTGVVAVGSVTAGQLVTISLAGDQTWANTNNTGTLTILNPISNGVAGARVLTLGGTSTAANVVSGVISDGSGPVSILKNGSCTWTLSGLNTFTGGVSAGAGILQLTTNTAAGTGVISFPDAGAGRTNVAGGVTLGNNVTVGTGQVGAASVGLLQQTGTGQATLNGSITLNGAAPTNGGNFVGGLLVGNELVINGSIASTLGFSQRDGRVVYRGGGTAAGVLNLTGTAIVGATNGIPTGLSATIGTSGNSFLELDSFNQTLAGLTLGFATAGSNNQATVNVGGNTLTLNGNITAQSSATSNVTHFINGGAGGTLQLGAAGRTVSVTDTYAADDLVISTPSIKGGPLTKIGAGALALKNVTLEGQLKISAGTLIPGTAGESGTITAPSLDLASNVKLLFNVGTANSDIINGGTVTTAGLANVSIFQSGGLLPAGTYPLLNYTGTTPGVGSFNLLPVGHANAQLVDTGTAIALEVLGNDGLIWTGGGNTDWMNGPANNWNLALGGSSTNYNEGDVVEFPDTSVLTVTVPANVSPSSVTFSNASSNYTFTGAGGIAGPTGLVKNGAGSVLLRTPNRFTGPTLVNEGTLELDHDATGNAVLTSTSGVTVAAGATLKLTRDDADFSFTRNLSGAGTVSLDAHTSNAGAAPRAVTLTGNNTAFTGKFTLSSGAVATNGSFRITNATPSQLGSASVVLNEGTQVLTLGSNSNNFTISGTGYSETAGATPIGLNAPEAGVWVGAGTALFPYAGLGALRLSANDVLSGNIVLNGNAKITAHNVTATIAGPITSVNPSDILVVNGGNANSTLITTNSVSVGTILVNGGSAANNVQQVLQVGNGGTTGVLNASEILIYGSPRADVGSSAVLNYIRGDGASIPVGQTISGAALVSADLGRIRVLSNTKGSGLTVAGTIDLADSTAGGILTTASSVAGSILNFAPTASVDVNHLIVGDAASIWGTVNQAPGSNVTVLGQVRIAHFGTEHSIYNMNGGSLTLTGAAPSVSPFTAVAGGPGVSGDNNIEGSAVAAITGGGIYVGIDGQGTFNHNAGNVTTNWIVLDNRADSVGGANTTDGIDRYRLNGGVLSLRSAYGIIQRNSAELQLNGGRVLIENSGTGPQTGANLTVSLDATIISTGNTTLDTGVATNKYLLSRNISGGGTLTTAGGGPIVLNPSTGGGNGQQIIDTTVAGVNPLVKEGAGVSIFNKPASYTGATEVNAGKLVLPNSMQTASLTAATGTTISGEPTIPSLTLNGATVGFDAGTPGALTTTNLIVDGVNLLDMTGGPTGVGPFTAINYTNKTGSGSFALLNPGDYRNPVVTDTGSSIQVGFDTGALTWTAAAGDWDINGGSNWNGGADKFFTGDSVIFDDTAGVATTVNLVTAPSSKINPSSVIVNSNTNNFTLNGIITGNGALTKNGSSVLTLGGVNTFSGTTTINGGVVSIASANGIGDASSTNTLNLNGGVLRVTATMNLGAARNVVVGADGGGFTASNAATTTVTVPGTLSGTGPLTFASGAAGAAVFVFPGDISGYTGNVTVNSAGVGVTTLRLSATSAVNMSSIRLDNPPSGTTGNATTLDLAGCTLPAASKLTMTSLAVGTNSYRSGLLSNISGAVVNCPIEVSGSSIIQINSGVANGITLNGDVTAGPSGFTAAAVFFLRGGGTGTVNGKITLPLSIVSKTDAATWTINSTGNSWASTNVLNGGGIKLGATNALPPTANLTIGQNSDATNSLLDLNGFDQTAANLTYVNGNGSSTRGIGNTAAARSTLTLNQTANATFGSSTGITGGVLSGNLTLVKAGSGNLTLAGSGTFTGDVQVNAGILTAGGIATSTVLGSPTTAGRTIAVNPGAELRLNTTTVFGNGIGNANLPTLQITNAQVSSTNYNVLGPVVLSSASLSQSTVDTGNYEGYNFRGDVTVTGAAPSFISSSNSKANHLAPASRFIVNDVTSSSAVDLTISSPLRDGSQDFGFAPGSLVKSGLGTLDLPAAVTHSFSGATRVEAGSLQLNSVLTQSGLNVLAGATVSGNGLAGGASTVAGIIAPGASVGTLSFGSTLALVTGSDYQVEIDSASSQDKIVVTGALTANGKISVKLNGYAPVLGNAFDIADASAISGAPTFDFSQASLGAGLIWDTSTFTTDGVIRVVSSVSDAYSTWASALGVTGGKFGDDDRDGSLNILEFATNSNPKSGVSRANTFGAISTVGGSSVLTYTVATRKNATFAASGSRQAATVDQIVYRVEASDDLATTWSSVVVTQLSPAAAATVQATLPLPTLGADWEWHTFRTDDSVIQDNRDMIRLNVQSQ